METRYRSLLAVLGILIFSLFSVCAFGASKSFDTKVLTLYDIGMMQVEKQVHVNGAQKLSLSVPLANLDDLLVSLMISGDGNVQVGSIDYPMVKNLGQALAAGSIGQSITDNEGEPTLPSTYSETLKAFIGSKIRLTMKANQKIEGTVMGVLEDDSAREKVHSAEDDNTGMSTTMTPFRLALVNAKGAMQLVDIRDILKVELVSVREAAAMADLVKEMGKTNGYTQTEVSVSALEGSNGMLSATYLQQIPKWRMWYRLQKKGDALWIEGWAQVHNDTSEDWREVEMTLVSGLPQSYMVSAASPRYGARNSMQLKNEGEMMPQLGALTPDRLLYAYYGGWGSLSSVSIGDSYGYGGLGLSGTGRGGGGSGEGTIGLGTVSLFAAGESAVEAQAEARVEEEISIYNVLSKVSVGAGSSAMVPVLNRKIDGELFSKASIANDTVETCAYVNNQTGVVLQSGLVSIYADSRFRGQSEISRTEPNEAALICYGVDQDITYSVKVEAMSKRAKKLEWKNDHLEIFYVSQIKQHYGLVNASGQDRQLGIVVEQNARQRIISPAQFRSVNQNSSLNVKFVTVPARGELGLDVMLKEARTERVEKDTKTLRALIDEKQLPPRQLQILEDVAKAREALRKQMQRVDRWTKEKDRLTKSVENDRTNLASLPKMLGRTRIARKLLESILEKSVRINKLEETIDTHQETLDTLQQQPTKLLAQLSMD